MFIGYTYLADLLERVADVPPAQVGWWLMGTLFRSCAVLGLWGIANTALYPICQVRVMACVSQAKALAGTSNVSAANAGIGLGAIIGGLTLTHLGTDYLGYVAACVALLALVLLAVVRRLAP